MRPARGGGRDGGRRQGGGGGRRGGAGGEQQQGGSSSHPLDRSGDSSSGPVRNERRRERAPRDAPYSRVEGRSEGAWVRGADAFAAVPKIVGDTVRLSNLNTEMTEEDIRYIFDKIGSIRSVTIHYNAQGKSVGTAEIQFSSTAAATLAVENLNEAEVDGRIMYVAMVGQVVQAPVVYQRRHEERRDDRRGGERRGDERRGGGDRQRREGGGGGGRQPREAGERKPREAGAKKGGREARPEAKAEDLDAEMDSYHQSKPQAAAAASSEAAAPVAAAAE